VPDILSTIRSKYFFDYPVSAQILWISIVAFGGFGALVALWLVFGTAGFIFSPIALFCFVLIAVTSYFPINLQHARVSVATSDVIIFFLLVEYGIPTAILAVALEGIIAGSRGSTRLTSRLATPSINVIGISTAGGVASYANYQMLSIGMAGTASPFVMLGITAILYWLITAYAILLILSLKKNARFTMKDILTSAPWTGALALIAAAVAGILSVMLDTIGYSLAIVSFLFMVTIHTLLAYYYSEQAKQHRLRDERIKLNELKNEDYVSKIHRMAYFDTLTELGNRDFLLERLGECARGVMEGKRPALLYVDLDRFKQVNDSLGHNAGDKLLYEIASRLKTASRPGDHVTRVGGDEFCIVLPDTDSVAEVTQLAHRILAEVEQPFVIEGVQIIPSASIGATMIGQTNCTSEQILREGDAAMYSAKKGRPGRFVIFETGTMPMSDDRLHVEEELRNGLVRGELELFYQPIYALDSCSVEGFEALVRWNHPKRGLLGSGSFIPQAEESGFVSKITRWAVTAAVEQLAAWKNMGIEDVSMHVNAAANDISQALFLKHIEDTLTRLAVQPSLFVVEITESSMMRDRAGTALALAELQSFGVKVSVDDFGTGYSSLSYLTSLPFDCIKIDRSFIVALPDDRSTEIVRTILALGKALGKRVIAEGIETQDEFERLTALGCRYGQGFLLGKPLTAEDATTLLKDYPR